MRMTKMWHLDDFSEIENQIFVTLDDQFHREFFATAIELAGSQRKLGKFLNSRSSSGMSYLFNRKRRPSLFILNKISKFLERNGKGEFSMKELEKHVISLGNIGHSTSISPRFPIKLDSKLVGVVANIIGDGGIDERGYLFYSNNDLVLIESFKIRMNELFKGCTSREYVRRGKIQVYYSNIIGKMLVRMFGPFSYGKSSKYIPSEIFDSSQAKLSFLEHLYGDEGTVGKRMISIYQGARNLRVLQQVRILLKEVGIEPNPIFKTKRQHTFVDPYTRKKYLGHEIYRFTITGYEDITKFSKYIGFPKNSEKEKKFVQMIHSCYKSKPSREKVGVTKNLILKTIGEKGPIYVDAIAQRLHKSRSTIYCHLQDLEKLGKICKIKQDRAVYELCE